MPLGIIAQEKLQLICHVHQLKVEIYVRKVFTALKEVVHQFHAMLENIAQTREPFYQLELVSQDIIVQVDHLQVFQQDQGVIYAQ